MNELPELFANNPRSVLQHAIDVLLRHLGFDAASLTAAGQKCVWAAASDSTGLGTQGGGA